LYVKIAYWEALEGFRLFFRDSRDYLETIYPFLVWSRVVNEHSTFLSISRCIPTTVLNGQVLFAIFAIGIMFLCRFHKAREEYSGRNRCPNYLFLLINQDHNGLFLICKILTHSKGTTCNCWTANQYKLCSLDLVEGLSIKSAGQSSGTSVRLSNLLSTVTPFMWITLNPGAIPLGRLDCCVHKLFFGRCSYRCP
jgi:hypothetical protein